MNCCSGTSFGYEPVDTGEPTTKYSYYTNINASSSSSTIPASKDLGYPGSKRPGNPTSIWSNLDCNKNILVRTGGNALMEYDPHTMSNLVRVTVPEGCWPSQMIQVKSQCPSYSVSDFTVKERVVNVTIPSGCVAGSSFLVDMSNASDFERTMRCNFDNTKSGVVENNYTAPKNSIVNPPSSLPTSTHDLMLQSQCGSEGSHRM